MTKLTIACGWCGKHMGEKDGQGVEGTTTSICDDCLLHNFPHHYEKIKRIVGSEIPGNPNEQPPV